MAEYRFLTTWCLDAPIEQVFETLDDCARWPDWWKGVERAQLVDPGDENQLDRVWEYTFRSRLPYALSFRTRTVRREPPHLVEAVADGELIGLGRWRLFEGHGTAVLYEWNVRPARQWMNRLAPVGRPAFTWNHDAVMREGGEGLARELGARLLARR